MRKFRAIVLQQARERVVAGLHEAGVAQLKETVEAEVARGAIAEEVYELSSLGGKLREVLEFVGPPPSAKPVEVEELPYERLVTSAKQLLSKLGPKVRVLRRELQEIDERRKNLLAQIVMLELLREFKAPLRYLQPTDELYVAVGVIAGEKVEVFLKEAGEALQNKVVASVVGKGKRRMVIASCRRKDQAKLLPVLYRHEVELIELPPVGVAPQKAMRLAKTQLAEAEGELMEIERARRNLGKKWAEKTAILLEQLEIRRERLESGRLFGYTDAAVLIDGWVPVNKESQVDGMLAEATDGRYVVRTFDPKPGEAPEVPIEFENPKVVKDFELITETYGLPRYDEVDPTPYIAITFPLFFAICLSDAGYGAALGIFMASGFWIAKAFPMRLRRIIVAGSTLTVVIGILMGGWFGLIPPLWINPIKNPVPILKIAIFLGILHLTLAYGGAAALKDVFRRDWMSLILEHIPKTLIVVGFFGLVFCVLGVSLREFGIDFVFPKLKLFEAFNPLAPAPPTVSIFRILLYAGLSIGIVGSVILAKELRAKLSGPINIIYGIAGLAADAASYSRLLALGLASGIIAFAINYIVGWLYGSLSPQLLAISDFLITPLVIFLSIVAAIAHCFNIFIQSLGAFIHTMRLHYVEFFGKFFEGGGEKFVPFKVKRVFTKT